MTPSDWLTRARRQLAALDKEIAALNRQGLTHTAERVSLDRVWLAWMIRTAESDRYEAVEA